MRWLSRLTTAGIFAAVIGGLVLLVWRARPHKVGGEFRTSALFRDALGLPIGSKVVIAGVIVGEIERLTVEGGQARIGMRLRDGTVLCDDAWATKKAVSALGDFYIELSPGDADPSSPTGCLPPRRRLRSGEPVPRVLEAASTDRVLRGIQNAMPRVDNALARADELIDEGRETINGPVQEGLADIDRHLASGRYTDPLRELDDGATRLDELTARIETEVAEIAPTANARMDQAAADIAATRDRLRATRGDLVEGLATARTRMDDADPYFAQAADVFHDIAHPDRERPGRLATLIHDPALADDVTSISEGVAGFTGSLDKLKTTMGFRIELNILAAEPRYYVTAQVAANADTFYLIELEKGHWGDVPEPSLTADGVPTWTRRTLIAERLRFTAQWGHRFGPLSLRAGIKDSMFGVGIDAALGNGHLKLSADVMESSFDRVPRLKMAAALAVYRTLYIVGGVDDALVAGGDLPIAPWPASAGEPIQFQELHYGRDFFVGLNLSFTDHDVNRMLLVYGGLIGAILGRG